MAYLHSLVIGLTALGRSFDALTRWRPLPFPPLETWHRLRGSGWYDGLVCGPECGSWKEDNSSTGFETCSREREWWGVIRWAKWDTLNGRYVFHPSIRCSVGQLILPFLSQAQSTATQAFLHALSSTTFDTPHTMRAHAISLCRFHLHLQHYLLRTAGSGGARCARHPSYGA